MSSTLIPAQDLVPSVSSRVVTIDATSMIEASPDGEFWVDFILPQDLHVAADDKVIMAGSERVTLNAGKGSIRLPTYDPDAKTVDGSSDWVILVKKSWTGKRCAHGRGCGCGGAYAIQVPVGTTTISLADMPAVRELTMRERDWRITGAGATVKEGAQWDVEASVNGSVINFDWTVPPGGEAWDKGDLTTSHRYETLAPGAYRVRYLDVADSLGLPVRRIGSLVVEPIGTSARTVRFTTDERPEPGYPLERWEVSSDPSGDWPNAWQRTYPPAGMVASSSVARIVTSTNYEEPISEGDLLVVTPAPRWFTDFSNDTVGQAPDGWTERWASPSSSWLIASDVAAQGGRVLRAEDTGAARTALSWDEVGNATDVEMVVKYRSATTQSAARVTLRGSGATADMNGYHNYILRDGDASMIGRILNGDVTASPDGPGNPWAPNTWCIVRFRVNGSTVKVKHWLADEPEPEDWTFVWAPTPAVGAAGWVGLQRSTNDRLDVDWVGVATDGGRAPMRAV